MGNRYKVLNSLEEQKEYLKGCPVRLIKGQIVEDLQLNKLLVQFKILNISDLTVDSAYVDVLCYDGAFDYVSKYENIAYQKVHGAPKHTFGDGVPVYLAELNIAYVKVIFTKVVFTNDTIWRNENKDLGILLPEQKLVKESDVLYQQIIKLFANKTIPKYWFECDSNADYWRCACGGVNEKEVNTCTSCAIKKDWLNTYFNREYLSLEKDKDDKKIIEEEQKKKDMEEEFKKSRDIKNRKIKKTLVISSITLLTIFLASFTWYKIYTKDSMASVAAKGNENKIKIMLKLGEDVNEISRDGATALSKAVETNNTDLVEFLIKNGADVNLEYSKDNNAVKLAIDNKLKDILQLLIDLKSINNDTLLPNKDKIIHEAVKVNDIEIVKMLLQNGFDINAEKSNGETPLSIALINGYEDMKNYLFDNGGEAVVSEEKDFLIPTKLILGLLKKGPAESAVEKVKIETTYKNKLIKTAVYFRDYKYTGDISNNAFNGVGLLTESGHEDYIYKGEWKDSLFDGKGKIFWNDSPNVLFDAVFEKGNFVSYTRYYQDGSLNDTGTVDGNGVVSSSKYTY